MEWWLSGAGGEGNEECLFNNYRVSVFQHEKSSGGTSLVVQW